MSSAIQQAMERAKEAAAATTGTAVATTGQGGVPATPAKKLSMDDMTGGLSVDKWIKVTTHGMTLGDSSSLITAPMKCKFDATSGVGFLPKLSIKAGNPASYASSYDGQVSDKGGSWADTILKMQQIDPKSQPYRSADLPFVTLEQVKAIDGVIVAEPGVKLGNSLSTTNWRTFEELWREICHKGLENKLVEVNVGFKAMSNKNGNKWGILTFELVGEHVVSE